MKIAHEILAEETIARSLREEKEERWTKLTSVFCGSKWLGPFGVQVFTLVVLLPVVFHLGQPGDFRGVYYISVWFLIITALREFVSRRKREKALLDIIEPALYHRLRDEKIV